MSQYFSKLFKIFRRNINVKIDLSSYATVMQQICKNYATIMQQKLV